MRNCIRYFILLMLTVLASCKISQEPVVVNGTIDLRSFSFDSSQFLNLDGDWLFYPNRFTANIHGGDSIPPVPLKVPGTWKGLNTSNETNSAFGYGSYKVTVILPKGIDSLSISAPNVINSYRLYVNNKEIGSVGTPGTSRSETTARISPRIMTFACSDTAHIEIDVANYLLDSKIIGGGIGGSILLGSPDVLRDRAELAKFVDILLVGGFLFITIFLLIFFMVYSKDVSYLYFSLFIGTLTVRFLASNSKFFFESLLHDSVSWAWMQRLELLGFYGAAAALVLYIYSFFGTSKKNKRIVYTFVSIDCIFCAITLFTPPTVYMLTLHPFQLLALLQIVYLLYMIIKAYLTGKDTLSAKLIGISLALFFLFVIIDILNASLLEGHFAAYFSAQGLFLFVIIQAWVLAAKFMQMFNHVSEAKEISEKHLKIIEMYTRKAIVDIIKTGNNPLAMNASSIYTCILFSDIRDFTAFTENLTPMETVATLNSYFTAMSECITRNNGEIDKLIGDCIMALFTDSDSAVNASVDMRKRLQEMNSNNLKARLYSGVGINFGEVIIGNIGSESKLDYTVIGDSVNSASRIESLTKYYNLPILISDEIRAELHHEHKIRFIDKVIVKGKKESISLFEVYDHEPEEIVQMKEKIAPQLKEAYDLYQNGDFQDALRIYRPLREKIGPHSHIEGCCADPLIDFCITRCENLLVKDTNGMLHDWNGVYEFSDK